jgi:hypothetical protein
MRILKVLLGVGTGFPACIAVVTMRPCEGRGNRQARSAGNRAGTRRRIHIGLSDRHTAARGPHDGFCDLPFINLLEGTWNSPRGRMAERTHPDRRRNPEEIIVLRKPKSPSMVGYIFAKSAEGKPVVTKPSLRGHFDEAYPKAIYRFDRLLRHATGSISSPRCKGVALCWINCWRTNRRDALAGGGLYVADRIFNPCCGYTAGGRR